MLGHHSTTGPVTRAIAAMRAEHEPPRRGFLRGAFALPIAGAALTIGFVPLAASEAEAAFLALAPRLTPMLNEYEQIWDHSQDLYRDARAARGGAHFKDTAAEYATPEWQAYEAARAPADVIGEAIYALYAPFEHVRMTTLPGILLRHRYCRLFQNADAETDITQDLDALVTIAAGNERRA